MKLTSRATNLLVILAALGLSAPMAILSPASADGSYVTDITWSTLYVKTGEGIVQQDRNIFDSKGVKLLDDSTQHPLVWVKKDIDKVTVTYKGGATQGNKLIQFIADNAGQPFTFADDIKSANKTVLTDAAGYAAVTYTVSGQVADSYLRVGIASCDYINAKASCPNPTKKNADLGGPLIIQWQKPGYYPHLKLDLLQSVRDVYWDWSEFKQSWVGERSRVYIKTYKVGTTINLPYTVTDVWGAPIADYPVTMIMQAGYCGGNIKCKWGNTPSSLYTDANGKVTFNAINKNTAAEACKNIDPTTKKRCGIGANFQPTTNQIPESSDIFWPQYVSDMTINPAAITYRVASRGGVPSPAGNDVTVGGVVNPPLPISSATSVPLNGNVKTTLNVSYLYNNAKKTLERVPLYAPDVKISASPGAYVLRVCPDTVNLDDCHASGMMFSKEVTSTDQMFTTQTFGYVFPPTLMFASSVPGLATFTMTVGNKTYTITQEFAAQ